MGRNRHDRAVAPPQRAPKSRGFAPPPIRDPRPASFAADATAAIAAAGLPCAVRAGGGGLACFASRHIRTGETILIERPLVLTVSHAARGHTCAHCIADSRKRGLRAWEHRCEGCGVVFYCSADCAAAAAARHTELECAAMAHADRAGIDDEDIDFVMQAIRIVGDAATRFTTDAGPAGVVGHGRSYAERLVGVTPSSRESRDALGRIVAATLKALPEAARWAPAALLDVLERSWCNLYGVSGADGEDVACASFVGFFHLLNHACCPNVVFDAARRVAPATPDGGAPCFALRALEDIAEGAELCISYTSSADGPAQRREHLREHYGFSCACARCGADEMEELDFLDRLDALRCTLDGCGSGLSVPVRTSTSLAGTPLVCVHCGGEWEAD